MRKIVVKTGGDSIGFRFNVEERKTRDIKEGQVWDLSDINMIEQASEDISNCMAKQKQPETMRKINSIVDDDNGFQD